MYSGIELASFELLIFLGISLLIRNRNLELQYLDLIAYLWLSFTFLTGIWEYYFIYCEAGFRERFIGDVQIVMSKPQNKDIQINY